MIKDVSHRVHAIRSPFIVAVCVECAFCVLMTRWMDESLTHQSPMDRVVFAQEKNFKTSLWIVFAVTVLGRLFCLVWSDTHILQRRSGRVVAMLYIFFGTAQWLFYLSVYYVEVDAASSVRRTHQLNLQIEEIPTLLSNVKGGDLTKCLEQNEWNYKACKFDVQGTCARPYKPGDEYQNGDCVSTLVVQGVKCCISEVIKMSPPQMRLFGHICDVEMIFMVIKWMAVLLMGWTLRHGFLAGNIGERSFTQGTWLDVLDAVIFSEFLNKNEVRYPAYGFTVDGKPQLRDLRPLAGLYITWLTAFSAVILSRIVYTALVPAVEENGDAGTKPANAEDADADTKEAPQGFPVRVVHDQESEEEHRFFTHCTTKDVQLDLLGRAVAQAPGSYLVTYDDPDVEPEVVSADRLAPLLDYVVDIQAMEEAAEVRVKAECTGWLDCSTLCVGSRYERFNHRARVLDAMRSLFLLQLPFMLWRLYFDAFTVNVVTLGGNFMLIAKNFVWCLMDLAIILSCTRKDASICSWKPIEFLERAAESRFGQVWVGPNGMVALVAEVGGSARVAQLERRKAYLESYKRWILSEQAVAHKSQRDLYSRPLQEVESRLLEVDEKMHFTFP